MRFFLVATMFVAPSILAMQQRPVDAIRISGVTIDAATERPIPGVAVQIGGLESVSNSQGQFAISQIPQGKQTLFATRDGYMVARLGKYLAPSDGINMSLQSGDEVTGMTLYLFPSGSLTGQIMNASGQPVSDAEILALPYRYDENGNQVLAGSKNPKRGSDLMTRLLVPAGISPITNENGIRTIRTDDRGQFRLFNLNPGRYSIAIRARSAADTLYYPGFSNPSDAESIVVESGRETQLPAMILKSSMNASLAIRIDDLPSEHAALRGILLRYKGGMDLFRFPLSGVRSIAGISLPPGIYEAEAVTGDSNTPLFLASARIEFETKGIDREIVISEPVGVPVSGVILADAGETQRLQNVQISVASAEVMSTFSISLTSDRNGGFTAPKFPEGLFRVRSIQGLPDGKCVREVRQNDRNVLRDGLNVAGPETTFQMLVADSMSTVRGHVTNAAGASVQGAAVVLVPENYNQIDLYKVAITDWKGFYELTCVQAGTYRLYSWLDIKGAAYRNADFMKSFEGAGVSVRVQDHAVVNMDMQPLPDGSEIRTGE